MHSEPQSLRAKPLRGVTCRASHASEGVMSPTNDASALAVVGGTDAEADLAARTDFVQEKGLDRIDETHPTDCLDGVLLQATPVSRNTVDTERL